VEKLREFVLCNYMKELKTFFQQEWTQIHFISYKLILHCLLNNLQSKDSRHNNFAPHSKTINCKHHLATQLTVAILALPYWRRMGAVKTNAPTACYRFVGPTVDSSLPTVSSDSLTIPNTQLPTGLG
jgi:hypothetical protein